MIFLTGKRNDAEIQQAQQIYTAVIATLPLMMSKKRFQKMLASDKDPCFRSISIPSIEWARKNGLLTQVNDTWLKAAPKEAKRDVGQRVNELKARAEATIEAAQFRIHASSSNARLSSERLDITLPGVQRSIGVKHPVLRVQD